MIIKFKIGHDEHMYIHIHIYVYLYVTVCAYMSIGAGMCEGQRSTLGVFFFF